MLDNYRKGITPVIAIALMLLITVGAVGVFWGTVQNFLGGEQAQQTTENLQRLQDLEIDISGDKWTDGDGNDKVNLSYRVTSGGGTYAIDEMDIKYKDHSLTDYVDWQTFTSESVVGASGAEDSCADDVSAATDDRNTFSTSKTGYCLTDINWPSSGESVSVEATVSAGSSTRSFTFTCSPTSSASDFC